MTTDRAPARKMVRVVRAVVPRACAVARLAMEGFTMPPNDDPSDPALIARWALEAAPGLPSGPGAPAPSPTTHDLAIVPTSEPATGAAPLFDQPPV